MPKSKLLAGLPESMTISAAAKVIGCHVSYIHKILRERPRLLNAKRMFGSRLYTVQTRGVLKLRAEVEANKRPVAGKGDKKNA